MAKPIVDGLERELEGTAQVIRLDVTSQFGRQIVAEYGISGMPTILVLDGAGQVVYRQGGPPSRTQVLDAIATLSQ